MESIPNKNPLAFLEDERFRHEEKCCRMENEMEEVFNTKLELKLKKMKKAEILLAEDVEKEELELKNMKEKLFELKEQFEKEKIISKNKSPSHSSKSFTSVKSDNSKKKIMYNLLEQMKIK